MGQGWGPAAPARSVLEANQLLALLAWPEARVRGLAWRVCVCRLEFDPFVAPTTEP